MPGLALANQLYVALAAQGHGRDGTHALDSVTLEYLGSARRIVATKDDTTIIDGAGTPDQIASGGWIAAHIDIAERDSLAVEVRLGADAPDARRREWKDAECGIDDRELLIGTALEWVDEALPHLQAARGSRCRARLR